MINVEIMWYNVNKFQVIMMNYYKLIIMVLILIVISGCVSKPVEKIVPTSEQRNCGIVYDFSRDDCFALNSRYKT